MTIVSIPDTGIALSCPVPISDYPNVLLAHGSGGRLMHQLLEKLVIPTFKNPMLEARHDGAVFPIGNAKLAFTTDSYVVHPLFFPGGDIGTLAVNGTVNDLAMCGAKPLYLSAGFILEEGLPMETLWRVIQSMQQAADAAGVQVVTGDTKVVDKGKGDGIFVNTSGIGVIEHSLTIAPSSVRPGDAILLNGDIGRHGMASLAVREGLKFESEIESDCTPLASTVLAMLEAGIEIHCLRDLTRGGLASGLVEIATGSGRHIQIDEAAVLVNENVRGACEILGLDPLYVANEGRFIAFVPADQADRAREIMGVDARQIGTVQESSLSCTVTMSSVIGANRIVDMLSGEQLPRIC
jgi:hydrogenase expression/formation protein HypE